MQVTKKPYSANLYLIAEMLAIFMMIPSFVAIFFPRNKTLLILIIICIALYTVLKKHYEFHLKELIKVDKAKIAWKEMLVMYLIALIPMVSAILIFHPKFFLQLPQEKFFLWLAICFFYPFFSVIPQGIIYRAFFRYRYYPIFSSDFVFICVQAFFFAFSHIVFWNIWAIILTLIGGVIFSRTYLKTGSLLVANIEHAIYGLTAFTLGYGKFLH